MIVELAKTIKLFTTRRLDAGEDQWKWMVRIGKSCLGKRNEVEATTFLSKVKYILGKVKRDVESFWKSPYPYPSKDLTLG